MTEDFRGIGYAVYSPSQGAFLGRMGDFYPDIRLAQIYAEPRAAKAAIARMGEPTILAVVPVQMLALGNQIDAAVSRAASEHKPAEPTQPATNSVPPAKPPVKAPTKAA